MFNPSALLGAVLYAWFPEAENPHQPGPKYRPVLVIDADPVQKRICLAYGTSQRVDVNGLGEITFRRNEIKGLKKDTKFCLRNRRWIPMTAEYLSRSSQSDGLVVLGTTPEARRNDLLDCIEEILN